MPKTVRGRVLVAVIALAVIADGVFWIHLFGRPAVKSAYVSPVSNYQPRSAPSVSTPAAAPLPLPRPKGRPLTVSIVGDSIADGHFVTNPYASYRSLILGALQSRGAVQPQRPVPDPVTGKAPDTAVSIPPGMDLVVLEVGSDDIARTDATTFDAAYSGLVKQVRATSPRAALVCAGTWTANGRAFDTVIEEQCAAARGSYVPLHPLYTDPANRNRAGESTFYGTTDGIAPNDAGHRAIAAALLKPIGVALR